LQDALHTFPPLCFPKMDEDTGTLLRRFVLWGLRDEEESESDVSSDAESESGDDGSVVSSSGYAKEPPKPF
jgi:hypothetical protein